VVVIRTLVSLANTLQLVFAHCDLLGGNIIIKPRASGEIPSDGVEEVHFVDFEYAMPTPAAFDIACHFSEWVGFDCDYNLLPTQPVRRAFLIEYIAAYNKHSQPKRDKIQDIDEFCKEVDSFRGLPGLFW
jgi:ethanolamine kinase